MPRRPFFPPTIFVLPAILLLLALTTTPTSTTAQQPIQAFTEGMEKRDGYLPLYWDDAGGRLYMEISRFGEEFYYLDPGVPEPYRSAFH